MMLNMTRFSVGLVSAVLLGALVSSPTDAQSPRRQQSGNYWQQPGYSSGVTKWPTNTPSQYVVCWNGCNSPNAIVMGADPDPFIRQQILKDGSGFFGNGGR